MTVPRRIIALIRKEFALILKDPKSRVVVIVPPLIQFFVFGYAATYDLKNVRYAVLDEDRSAISGRLLARLDGSESFARVGTLTAGHQVAEVLDGRQARLVVHIGSGFSRDLHNGAPVAVQVLVDGRNSNSALLALGYIGTIVEQFNRQLAAEGLVALSGPGVALVERAWFNPNLQSRWYIVSALGGIISMVVVMILTSLSVAREREFGTFDQLLVAPFTPAEILIGKSLPGICFGLIDALLFSLGAVFWYGVPFRGSPAALLLVLIGFVVTIVGVGLLVSSMAKTMQQALMGAFVFMMPAVILSGFTTPIENMPGWLQAGTLLNPVRYIITALRLIFLQGADTAAVWPQLWPLLVMAAVTLPVAGRLFRHRSQ
ncbi:ABC transporter permease [Desulfatitalea alkaliphila]|uniref:ABC transporter permease n=1 Tax=Desulfatitalea alkaliphila TaxID=2929485 RepID=A0AA41R1G1_9BACT|nr:ABC transporter permease [Desulfatitalea alkaliphila]MCJ8500274.1 ABC transporter permease [Desulfatitalea alkaliphila]